MSVNKLTGNLKQKLIQQSLQRKLKKAEEPAEKRDLIDREPVPERFYRFDQHPGYTQMLIMDAGADKLGLQSPFFRVHEGIAGATSQINGQPCINYASYNYLGFSGHPEMIDAAQQAAAQYGTSVSASRAVSGERPIHQQLERAIAECYEVDDAVAFVSGHATNVSTIGYLFGPKDLILHDELIHNSSVVGSVLSGAKRMPFGHNDMDALETLLVQHRRQFERVLIVVEGLYSMDGDIPDLARLVELKQKHKAFLMVDEAHSFGTLGRTGLGLREHAGINSKDVDIWMGTLSKSMAGCGGYIAGEKALVEHLRYLAPGFLYSVGMPAQVAAPSLAALQLLKAEPERVTQLQQISQYFLNAAHTAGFDTGDCEGIAVIPVLVGSSINAAKLSQLMLDAGINVQPILYPAVPEGSARLRFFLSCEHTEAQVDATIAALKKAYATL